MTIKQRRTVEVSGLAFLDVISCGFGALILMLVLTKANEPIIIENDTRALSTEIVSTEARLAQARRDLAVLMETIDANRREQDQVISEIDRTSGRLNELEAAMQQQETTTLATNTIVERLMEARQFLTDEMKRLLVDYEKSLDNNTIGGIPVDSEYVIFVIDTSGSMFNYAWPLVVEKLSETLEVYPNLKGIQVMNDMGQYMFSQYTGQWIPDSPSRRKQIVERLKTWNAFSNSSPVEGITTAIATFYRPGRKISIYVFGDEFNGRSIQRVVETVDRINQPNLSGERLVRIHAVGFPVQFENPAPYQTTGIQFAILMRAICSRNGGTFVALQDWRRR
jgi:hypothetical protein